MSTLSLRSRIIGALARPNKRYGGHRTLEDVIGTVETLLRWRGDINESAVRVADLEGILQATIDYHLETTKHDGSGSSNGGASGSVNWGDIIGVPSEFPPEDHTHAIADVTGLAAALGIIDGKADQALLDAYDAMLAASAAQTTADAAQLAAILAQGDVDSLEATTISTPMSVIGGGALSSGMSLALDGDVATPGNSKLYGTNAVGVKGWYDQPGGGGGGISDAPDSNHYVRTNGAWVDADARYVNITGDTMTGNLVVNRLGSGSAANINSYGDTGQNAAFNLGETGLARASFVWQSASGATLIQGRDSAGSNAETFLRGFYNDRVELFFDNAIKLATSAAGGTLTGTWNATTALSEAGVLLSAKYVPIAHKGAGGIAEHPLFTPTVAGFVPPPTTVSGRVLDDSGNWVSRATGASGGVVMNYRFTSDVSVTDPASGRLKFDNVVQNSTGTIRVHETSDPGNNLSLIWDTLGPGDYLQIFDGTGASSTKVFLVTGAVVDSNPGTPGGFRTIPVSAFLTAGGDFGNNNALNVGIVYNPLNELPTGGTTGQYLRKTSATDYATAWAGIIIGEVTGLQTALDGKVNDTGDTMTGDLFISPAAASAVVHLSAPVIGTNNAILRFREITNARANIIWDTTAQTWRFEVRNAAGGGGQDAITIAHAGGVALAYAGAQRAVTVSDGVSLPLGSKLIIGHNASLGLAGSVGPLQIHGTSDAQTMISSVRYSADASGVVFSAVKTRSAVIGVIGAGAADSVVSSDVLATYRAYASDGSATLILAGAMTFSVGAAAVVPGSGVIGCRITFNLMDNAGFRANALNILENGSVNLTNSNFSGDALGVNSVVGLRSSTKTYTDLTSAVSAVNAVGYSHLLAGHTIAAANTGVVYTELATLGITGPPIAGTNVTITNPWSLRVNSGLSAFGAAVRVGGLTPPVHPLDVTGNLFATMLLQAQTTEILKSAASASITASELRNGIVEYSGTGGTLTLTNGTNMDTNFSTLGVDQSWEFNVVNTGTGTAVMTMSAGWTAKGNMSVTAGTSAAFRARRTAAATYTLYRLAGGAVPGAMTYVGGTTLGAAATNLGLSGLDLGVDESYFIQFEFLNATATQTYLRLRFNGDTTDTNYWYEWTVGGGTTVTAGNGNDSVIGVLNANEQASGTIWIRKDVNGLTRVMAQYSRGGTGGLCVVHFMFYWTSAANMTSLNFNASIARSLETGSKLRCFKVKQ